MNGLLRKGRTAQWAVLVLGSGVLSAFFSLFQVPAAALLGCMLCAIAVAVRGATLAVSRWPFALAQGVIGMLMARSLNPAALARVAADWPLLLGSTLAVMAASAVLGWWLMRRQVLAGTTAVWGLAPGAASAMVLMADAYGADGRLVAFMQYLRVVVVTLLASLVAHWAAVPLDAHLAEPTYSTSAVVTTLLVAGGSAVLARWLAIPAGPLLVPLVLATAAQAVLDFHIALPTAVLALAYALIGWSVGLRFTPAVLGHAVRALPQVLASIVALILLGLLIAATLVLGAGYSPLSAYLATSPGGADSVAVIAAHAQVDRGFVMAMQIARFVLVLLLGPALSRWVAGLGPPATPPPKTP